MFTNYIFQPIFFHYFSNNTCHSIVSHKQRSVINVVNDHHSHPYEKTKREHRLMYSIFKFCKLIFFYFGTIRFSSLLSFKDNINNNYLIDVHEQPHFFQWIYEKKPWKCKRNNGRVKIHLQIIRRRKRKQISFL